MSQSYNSQLVVLIASLLLVSGTKAKAVYSVSQQKVNFVLNKIFDLAKTDYLILSEALSASKDDLEKTFGVYLTNLEFAQIRSSIEKLVGHGVDVRIARPQEMILATQEYQGGGAVK